MTNSRNAYDRQISGLPALIGTLAMCVLLPTLVVIVQPLLIEAMVVGSVAWLIAVVCKIAIAPIPRIQRALRRGKLGSTAWGLYSGSTELGIFAYAVVAGWIERDVASAIAAGIGAASVEIIFTLSQGVLEELRHPDPLRYRKWLRGARRSLWVRHMVLVERLSATLIHVGARGLVTVTIISGMFFPVIVALSTFAAVDGLSTFGVAQRWNWFNPVLCRRFYRFVLMLGLIDCVVLALTARGIGSH